MDEIHFYNFEIIEMVHEIKNDNGFVINNVLVV